MHTNEFQENREKISGYISYFALVSVAVYFFYIGYGLFIGSQIIIGLAITFLSVVFLALYFNISGKHIMAKSMIFALTSLSVWVTYHICTLGWTIITSYVPIVIAYFFFFQLPEERKCFKITGVFILITFISCFVIPRHVLATVELSSEIVYMSNIIHLIISSSVSFVVLFLVRRDRRILKAKYMETSDS